MNTVFARNDTQSGVYKETINPLEVRAAIYCRLSKDDGEREQESSSIQTQRALLESYCSQQGWEVVAAYQDDGYTGLNTNRPDLQRMLKAIERRQIDIVLTKEAYVKQILKISEIFFPSIIQHSNHRLWRTLCFYFLTIQVSNNVRASTKAKSFSQ